MKWGEAHLVVFSVVVGHLWDFILSPVCHKASEVWHLPAACQLPASACHPGVGVGFRCGYLAKLHDGDSYRRAYAPQVNLSDGCIMLARLPTDLSDGSEVTLKSLVT